MRAGEAYTVDSHPSPRTSWARRIFSGFQHALRVPVATGSQEILIADALTGRVVRRLDAAWGDEGDLLAQVRGDLDAMTAEEFAAAYEIDPDAPSREGA